MAQEIINNPFVVDDLSEANTIHRTYKMDFENNRIAGMVDGLEATQQAIVKELLTTRFAYQIYDDQYGCDIGNKIGNASLTKEYIEADIPTMINDMLSTYDTVVGLQDIEYEITDVDSAYITLYIETIYGSTSIEQIVSQSGSSPSTYSGEFRDLSIRNGNLYAQQARMAIYQRGSLNVEIRDGLLYAIYDETTEGPDLILRDGGLYVDYG